MCSSNNIPLFYRILPQLLPSFVASLSAISDGMHFGWSSPALPLLNLESSPVKITENDETWLESCYLISPLLGLPITLYLLEKIGPRKTISIASCITMTSWIIVAVANAIEWLYFSRILSGIASNPIYVATPMYISEIADPSRRGFLLGLYSFMQLFGILLINSIAPFTPYVCPSIVGISVTVLQLILYPTIPESPYFLLVRGRKDEAAAALKKLRVKECNTDDELEEIAKSIEIHDEKPGKFLDLILVKSNRKSAVIATLLIVFQQFGGSSITVMNIHSILSQSDEIYIKPEYVGIAYSLLMVIAALMCLIFVDIVGRRKLLILSGVFTGICLLTLSIYFTIQDLFGVNTEDVGWIPVVSVMSLAVGFKSGLGSLPQLLISELFSVNVRNVGMTLGDASLTICSFLSVVFFKTFAQKYGIFVPFYVLTIVSFSSSIFTVFCVPETKGKSLAEIQSINRQQEFNV